MPQDTEQPDEVEEPVGSPFDIEVGAKLRLKDGTLAQVVDNPRDGVWVFCRALSPDGEQDAGAVDPVYLDDVKALVRPGPQE